MDKARTNFQLAPLVLLSIGIAVTLLLFILLTVDDQDNKSLKTINLATGEWAPYTGSDLPEYGIATAVVTQVLRDSGYTPKYHFMAWTNAEESAARGESDQSIRGIFPYSDIRENEYEEDARSSRFYFSDSILDIEIAVFYHLDNNSEGEDIEQPSDLLEHQIVVIKGYEYPPQLSKFIASQNSIMAENNVQAFELLAEKQNLVVLEALEVGEQLLEKHIPKLLPDVRTAPLKVYREVRLMLSKRNPNNLSLLRTFNEKLNQLKANHTAFLALQKDIKNRISMGRAVELVPVNKEQLIFAYRSPDMKEALLLPQGSRGVVKLWDKAFLEFQKMPLNATNTRLVQIKLLNGPYAKKNERLYVNANAIRLVGMHDEGGK